MRRNILKIILTVFIDLAAFAALILSFAWFHHAKPSKVSVQRTFEMPTVVPQTQRPPVTQTTDTPEPGTTPGPTPVPTETPRPTGLLGTKYAEKFTDGEVICDENGYRSADVCIEISRHEMYVGRYPVKYCVADIYIQNISSFRCAIAENESHKETVVNMARANNAIVALSGDYFLHHGSGLAIRNGVVYREKLHRDQDVCVLYADGTMETYFKGQVDLDYIYSKTPFHAWSFGPKLLNNGQPMTEFNTSVETWNPRAAIGYYEPGHYCFVIVDGRQEGYSYGLLMKDLSKLMYDLGCTEAYNLDGGMTAMMAYNGELYSQPCGGGRKNCDILYIAEP